MATPVVLVLLIVFTVLRGQGAPAGGTSTDDTIATGTGSGSSGSGSVNLLADPSPALDAFAGIYEGPPKVRELFLHPDLATIDVQVAGEPTHVDEYVWRDGELTGPEPVQLLDMELETLQTDLFDLSEIDPGVIPVTAQAMLQNCPGEGLELSQVLIQRDLGLDRQGRTLMLIYADNPDRGGGGYIAYTLDGTLVANQC